jgi:hypothetical protein
VRYISEQMAVILERISFGESLWATCKVPAIPSEAAVRYWVGQDHEGCKAGFDAAREVQAHRLPQSWWRCVTLYPNSGRRPRRKGLGDMAKDPHRCAQVDSCEEEAGRIGVGRVPRVTRRALRRRGHYVAGLSGIAPHPAGAAA